MKSDGAPHVVEIARQAMVDCQIDPQMKPIRGGTDGAQLSFRVCRVRICLPAAITTTASMSL